MKREQEIMAAVSQLQRQLIEYTTSLYNEGCLDDQFMQLQKMRAADESDPDFVTELVSVFLDDSEELLKNLATALQQKTVDYKQVAFDAHRFKGSSSNIGAQRVRSVCTLLLSYCKEKNLDRCLWCLHQANHEYVLVRNKFEALFRLEKQILQAGGSIPMVEYIFTS